MKETKPAPEKKTDQNKDGGSEFIYHIPNIPLALVSSSDASQGCSYLPLPK